MKRAQGEICPALVLPFLHRNLVVVGSSLVIHRFFKFIVLYDTPYCVDDNDEEDYGRQEDEPEKGRG